MNFNGYYKNCTLCPHECKADRTGEQRGFCGESDKIRIARAALHMWEEPCLSGKGKNNRGSGTVFFSGCTMRCCYCQNRKIASGRVGKEISVDRLIEIFYQLREKGAYNINLVTPDCFLPSVAYAVDDAKKRGFDLPFVFNISGYEKAQTLNLLNGLCDIYLTDFRYTEEKLSVKYSSARDYPNVAKKAIDEMISQQGECIFDENGILQRGVIVRLLLLPGHLKNTKNAVKYLFEKYGDKIIFSLMSQYTPNGKSGYDNLERRVFPSEYDALCDYADKLGIKNAYTQEGDSAKESFIPDFDFEGV